MPRHREMLRVFLASPGDLQAERRIARDIALEVDEYVSSLGFGFELYGWEDTVSQVGRPQEIINQEVDVCDIFIGMLWMRWGSSPGEGYTSGFQEEYMRAMARRSEGHAPEICLLFKDFADAQKNDPGEQARLVLDFKQQVTEARDILYTGFADEAAFAKLFRKHLMQYAIKCFNAKQSDAQSVPQIAEPIPENIILPAENSGGDPASFLENMASKFMQPDIYKNISAEEIARLRLLSISVSKVGNSESFISVHDANLLFLNRIETLSRREIHSLVEVGLKNFYDQNVPMWHWLLKLSGDMPNNLISKSITGDGDVASAAIDVLGLLETSLDEVSLLSKPIIIKHWLGEADRVKRSALLYLRRFGSSDDLVFIGEMGDNFSNNINSLRHEARIGILLRNNPVEAVNERFNSVTISVSEDLDEEILSHSELATPVGWRNALEHTSIILKIASIKYHIENGKLDAEHIQILKNDTNLEIRSLIVDYLVKINPEMPNEEIRKILVRPSRSNTLNPLFIGNYRSDATAEERYNSYLLKRMREGSYETLKELSDESFIKEDDYLVFHDTYFSQSVRTLRRDVDNRFEDRFNSGVEYLTSISLGVEKIVSDYKIAKDYIIRSFLRGSLNILAKRQDVADLARLRKGLKDTSLQGSYEELSYFKKHGKWSDIPFLLLRTQRGGAASSILGAFRDKKWHTAIASTVYAIANERLEGLLKIEMPPEIKSDIIQITSIQKFSYLSDDMINILLREKNDRVRKVTVLKIILTFPKRRVEELLKAYSSIETSKFYNVLHLLDMGVSLSIANARRIANEMMLNKNSLS